MNSRLGRSFSHLLAPMSHSSQRPRLDLCNTQGLVVIQGRVLMHKMTSLTAAALLGLTTLSACKKKDETANGNADTTAIAATPGADSAAAARATTDSTTP